MGELSASSNWPAPSTRGDSLPQPRCLSGSAFSSCSALAIALLSACGDGEGTCAPPAGTYPLRAEVIDASTGEALCGVRVHARSGDREALLAGECSYAG